MAIEIEPLSDKHSLASQALAERMPESRLSHAPVWGSVFPDALGHGDRSLVALRDGEVCGLLPLMHLRHWLFGTSNVSLPWLDYGGVVASDADVAQALLDAATAQARTDRASFVELRSVDPTFPVLPVRQGKVTFWLSLRDADAVWRGLNGKVRNQVRKAQKAGLTCDFGREELLPDFYRVFARNMRDLGTPVWGITLFEKILEAFPKSAEVTLVRLGQKPIGGGLVVSFKDTVYMPSASSLRPYFHLCPNTLLYWEVIRLACERGYRFFDFGRSTVGSGPYHFKKQWGALVKPLNWQYILLDGKKIHRLEPSSPLVKVLMELWKRLPVRFATWLGPRIVRHLP